MLAIVPVEVHLAQAVKRQQEGGAGELCREVVVLEGLVEVALHVEGPGHLIAGFGAHRLVLRVVEGVQGELVHLGVLLLVEEVVGQVVQHHRVRWVEVVCAGQLLDTLLDRFLQGIVMFSLEAVQYCKI